WKYGLALTVLKLSVDAAITWFGQGVVLNPLPFGGTALLRQAPSVGYGDSDSGLVPGLLLLAWAIPFFWIAVNMTVKRARDARWPVSLALMTFVPIANLVTFVVLGSLPSRGRSQSKSADDASDVTHGGVFVAPNLIVAGGCAIVIGVVALSVSSRVSRESVIAPYFGAAFLMGFVFVVLGRARLARMSNVLIACTWLSFIWPIWLFVVGGEAAFGFLIVLLPAWILTMIGGAIGFSAVQVGSVGRR
ncbi:MAG: hypothetical protein KDC95_21895, partial [Planctomycetes bacterium]|nr:hypothetical protein [Planctomycetota bacterium]